MPSFCHAACFSRSRSSGVAAAFSPDADAESLLESASLRPLRPTGLRLRFRLLLLLLSDSDDEELLLLLLVDEAASAF